MVKKQVVVEFLGPDSFTAYYPDGGAATVLFHPSEMMARFIEGRSRVFAACIRKTPGLLGYILDLAVPSALRGRGIGSAILQAVLRKLREMGAAEVFLRAIPEEYQNLKGLVQFYKRHGFKIEESCGGVYPVMRKSLAGASLGDAGEARWQRCGKTPFYRRVFPAQPDGAVYADPFAGQLVAWNGHPEAGGPQVSVTLTTMPQNVHPEVMEEVDKRLPAEMAMALSELLLYMDLLRFRGFSEEQAVESIDQGFEESKKRFFINSFVRLVEEFGSFAKTETWIVPRDELDEVLAARGITGC